MAFSRFLRGLIGISEGDGQESVSLPNTSSEPILPVTKKVLLVIHDPTLPDGRTVRKALRWGDPDDLTEQYINDMREISYGYCNYEIAERVVVDEYPVKIDGFQYTSSEFVRLWTIKRDFHQPDAVDYRKLLEQFEVVEKVNRREIDELWLFGFPYAGYYESMMVGPGAFWCNAPALDGTVANRKFVVMGFNYERGVGEMLEAMGHRAESIMKHTFRNMSGEDNLWERFIRYDKTHPTRAEVGNVHFAPNSDRDYDWGNPRPVLTRCDNWLNFPDLNAPPQKLSCSAWGHGDIRKHHKWWFKRFPHISGHANGISYNWWEYVIDPNLVM